MPDALDTHAVEHTARQLLDARINAVRELATAQVAVDHARDALATAETTHASVYAAATRDAELKQIGLTSPTRRTPGRPRRLRTGARAAGTQRVNDAPAAPASRGAQHSENGG